MASVQQIMEGLEDRLKTIDGLRTGPFPKDGITPPCAWPLMPPINYHETMNRGLYEIEMQILVLTSANIDRAGQQKLAGYASPYGDQSVIVAVENDKTLGGLVDDLAVMAFNPTTLEQVGALGYFGGLFDVKILVPGD